MPSANAAHLAGPCVAPKIARGGILARVKFDQWHIIHAIRGEVRNINALNMACLLAALARMDCAAYEMTQSEIAAKMAEHFGGEPPTRQAVAKWEKMLKTAGLIEIPRASGRGNVATKRRYFTDRFLQLSRRNMPEKISYIGLHATEHNPALHMGEKQVSCFSDLPVSYETKIRAIDHIGEHSNSIPARVIAKNGKKEKIENQPTRPPKFTGKKTRPLSRFENSIRHWIFQNWAVDGVGEASILFALFLELQKTDEMIGQLAAAWPDCTDAARPGMVSGLVRHLRQVRQVEQGRHEGPARDAAARLDNLVNFPAPEPAATDSNAARALFRAALLGFVSDYSGPCGHIVERFKVAPIQEQEMILNQFQRGIFDQWFSGAKDF